MRCAAVNHENKRERRKRERAAESDHTTHNTRNDEKAATTHIITTTREEIETQTSQHSLYGVFERESRDSSIYKKEDKAHHHHGARSTLQEDQIMRSAREEGTAIATTIARQCRRVGVDRDDPETEETIPYRGEVT